MALPTDLDVLVQRMRDVTQELAEVKTAGPAGPNRPAVLAQLTSALDAVQGLEKELKRLGLLNS